MQTTLAGISGQGCVLPTRMLVHDAVYDDARGEGGGTGRGVARRAPVRRRHQLGPVINDADCERILGVIDAARASGAGTLVTGGGHAGGDLADGYFVQPTVFGDVDDDSDLAQREVFGPVLALMRFTDEDDAVALANGTTYGLGAIVFTATCAAPTASPPASTPATSASTASRRCRRTPRSAA